PCWNGLMVPGSTLMYGSSLTIAIFRPRASRMAPSDAAAMPFPNEETTPPVVNTYLVMRDPVARGKNRIDGPAGYQKWGHSSFQRARNQARRARRRDLSFAAMEASTQRSPAAI